MCRITLHWARPCQVTPYRARLWQAHQGPATASAQGTAWHRLLLLETNLGPSTPGHGSMPQRARWAWHSGRLSPGVPGAAGAPGTQVARTQPVPQELRGWVPGRSHAWHRDSRTESGRTGCPGEDADPRLPPVLPLGQAPARQHLWTRGHSQDWRRRWTRHGVSRARLPPVGWGPQGPPQSHRCGGLAEP